MPSMLKDVSVLLLLTIGAALASAQEKEKEPVWALKFQDYAVSDVFKGKPAPPVLGRGERFRTMIRLGAAKGPNFAGHYTVVTWGCGAGCVALVLVDAITGRIYDMPFGSLAMISPIDASLQKGPRYKLKSRLFIADGCPNEEEKKCGTHYYEWKDNKFALLRFDPLPKAKTERR
jgi:hypothetical protein